MKFPESRGLLGLLLVLSLTACGTQAIRGGEVSSAGEAMVAENLVLALAQVPALNPLINTVQMSPPNTTFGERVAALLADSGYGIQTVDGDTGEFYVRYREETIRSELGLETSFLVAIGDISAARSFDTAERDKPVPLSPLFIAGAAEFDVVIDDSPFGPGANDVSYAQFDDVARPQVFDFDTQTAVLDEASPEVTIAGVPGVSEAPQGSGIVVKENVYNRISSNYVEVFRDYDDVRSEVLIFENDSMRLGDANKRTVQQYVDAFNPDTDLVSIIGCSHGNTAVRNGNAVLAVGRANRVKEAFLFAGLEGTKVLEEGCWAGDYHETMPRRGVLLTLKRRAG